MSISNFLETKLVDLVFNATAYAGQSTVYVKLHTADPGEDCIASPATNATRAAVTFGAAVGPTVTSDSAANWTNVPAGETYSHVSLWDAATAGNPLWYGALTVPVAVTSGNNFSISAGALTVTVD